MAELGAIYRRILKAALAYPGAWEDHPWGENVAKVGKKVFLFSGISKEGWFSMSFKLAGRSDIALSFPFASPTGYGLGKAGWISVRFEKGQDVPEGLLLQWLDESYRSIAPAKLLKELDAKPAVAPEPARKAPARKTPARKRAAGKAAPARGTSSGRKMAARSRRRS